MVLLYLFFFLKPTKYGSNKLSHIYSPILITLLFIYVFSVKLFNLSPPFSLLAAGPCCSIM
ncbi:uncharacterized protein SPAR_M04200 [Saccharomyces paradoxus]|uniref:Uncharacterized protein n=1 Tax=Saccharomyces paradoxus TaxID=27291 RepID=A0A8B8UXW9_SACPA|nr:uncharacterized protein SPAR_M04200 [Saccharomyces paradoxus]QHS75575.1 hypothetical protein SPAR_M04200 [Saccharomyces paradoxus]